MEPLAEERNHLQSVDGSPAGTEHAGWVALHERLKRVVHVPSVACQVFAPLAGRPA
jgi:hypothetical protein